MNTTQLVGASMLITGVVGVWFGVTARVYGWRTAAVILLCVLVVLTWFGIGTYLLVKGGES